MNKRKNEKNKNIRFIIKLMNLFSIENKYSIRKIIFFIKNNPSLIIKFIVAVKNRGLSSTLLKLKGKLEYQQHDNRNITILDEVIKHYNLNSLDDILSLYKNRSFNKFDIVIPIYNGFEFLKPLFDSVVKNTTLPYRLIIGNDSSSDRRIIPFINSFIDNNPNIEVLFINNQENLGFLKTVNLLAENVNNHLVILNTDTEVPPFWLERLMYPILIDEKVASTTPFTNSGVICSFPEYLQDNEIYRGLNVTELDLFFQKINVRDTMIRVPTGVGFCMGMNFNVIKEIGFFDEIYGKGYGEENDWCQRAISAGYYNLHITNLFIYHKHGGSFLSEDKIKYINKHYNLLLKKFPNYDDDIQSTIKEDRLRSLREFIQILVDFRCMENANLVIDHNLGGGANSYRNQKINESLEINKPTILYYYDPLKGRYVLRFITDTYSKEFFAEKNSILLELFKHIDIDSIIVNELVSFPNVSEILNLSIEIKDKLKAKLIFPIHDYFEVCPSYTLLNYNGKFCNIPEDLKECEECLKKNKNEFKIYCNENNIQKWRKEWGDFLEKCDEILCFSISSKDILLKAYPKLNIKNIVYEPHNIKGRFSSIYLNSSQHNKRIIGVLGNINFAKGRGVIDDLVKYIDKNNLDLSVVLIGNIDTEINSNNFTKTGSYSAETLPTILKKYNVSEFLIPSIWPETFSYTTDEVMQLGYPLTVFDIGAPAERVRNYRNGRVISLKGDYIKEVCKKWVQ